MQMSKVLLVHISSSGCCNTRNNVK